MQGASTSGGKPVAPQFKACVMRSLRGASLLLALCGLLLLTGSIALASDAGVSREDQLKVAFVFHFTKFVDWPAASFPSPHDPLVIGVLGPVAICATLERIVQDRHVNGHPIRVKQVATTDDAEGVHVLFVTAAEDARFAQIRTAIATSPILTVGESESFRDAGGTITFVLQGDKVRFEIDAGAAEQSGLRISAQLQKLARAVRRAP